MIWTNDRLLGLYSNFAQEPPAARSRAFRLAHSIPEHAVFGNYDTLL